MYRRRRLLAGLLGCVALLTSGCSSHAQSSRDPNTVISLTRTDGATMNPLFAQTVQDGTVYAQMLYESLSYIGADYLPHPRLATSWAHSADGKRWVVNLRHGVRWSDGVPFTSRDVVFTYDAMIDPKTAAFSAADFTYIKKVTAAGPFQVIFELAYPSAVFTSTALGFEASILPEHILGSTPHDRLRFTSFGEHPVGTGPYMLDHWQHDTEALFVRNPYAWRRAKIARFDVHVIFDEQAMVDAIASGSADLDDDLSSTRYRQLKRIAPEVQIQIFDSVYVDVATPNLKRPGLSDVMVRRAMMYGQDRVALIKGFFADAVPLPDSLIPKGLTHWYTSDVMQYPYDPAKARALLDASGWRVGPDGVRRKGNVRLAFEDLLNQGSVIYTSTSLAFIADMQAIGIKITLRQLDFASMISRGYAGNFDLIEEGYGGSTDPDPTGSLATSAFPPNGANLGRVSDPVLDRQMKAGLIELDDAKRQAIYRDVQREMARFVPIFFQYGRFAGLAHSERLVLAPKTTMQSPLLYYNIDEWSVKT